MAAPLGPIGQGKRAWFRGAIPILLVWAAIGCGVPFLPSDVSRDVAIENRTNARVVVYLDGRRDLPALRMTLGPGETWRDGWLWPVQPDDVRRRKVEAEDEQGNVIFCKRYSRLDLDQIGWRIEMTAGVASCD